MEAVVFDGSQPATPVGHYTYLVNDDVWSWSDGVYLMHGYTPREVPATTEVLMRHKHPDDRARAAEVLDAAVRDGQPFSCYHRIIDRHEHVRNVLSVGRGIENATGRVERVEGYFVDLTTARREETEAEVQRALAGIAAHREAIDLAKGMIMVATGTDSTTAFGMLRRYSQNTNLKVHDVAQRLVDAAPGDRRHHAGWVIELLDGLPSHEPPNGRGNPRSNAAVRRGSEPPHVA